MGTLYENILSLCEKRNIKPGRVCNDLGLSRGLMTDLKMGRKKSVSAETANKIADYFKVSVGYLLTGKQNENAPAEEGEDVSDNDIKFALFGGDGEITDEMFNEVKSFAQYVKQRERDKQK